MSHSAKFTFKLTGQQAGQSMVIMDRYVFVDGKMEVIGKEKAEAYARILCEYYAVEMVEEPVVEDEPKANDVSLNKAATKGSTKADKGEAQ